MKVLTLPKVTEQQALPYVAVKAQVNIPFDDQIPGIMKRLFDYLEKHGVQPTGPVFFKYNVIAMPAIEMEFGVPVERTQQTQDDVVSGVLPAGRYAEITYFGHYDDLMTVNGVLVGWARQAGLGFDAREVADGEWFACRLEVYHNGPEEEPDPQKWQTTVRIKLKD